MKRDGLFAIRDRHHAQRIHPEALAALGVPCETAHPSGHASTADQRRLAGAVAPRRRMPVHTDTPEAFAAEFDHVSMTGDGEWRKITKACPRGA